MEKNIKNFYDLVAWQKAHQIAIAVYELTKNFPEEEKYGITSQLRRAASSIAANIAEGFARYHFKDKNKFYRQSRASAAEVQNFLILARDLKFISPKLWEVIFNKIKSVIQLINGLIRSINARK